jgi:hypothetical protein
MSLVIKYLNKGWQIEISPFRGISNVFSPYLGYVWLVPKFALSKFWQPMLIWPLLGALHENDTMSRAKATT